MRLGPVSSLLAAAGLGLVLYGVLSPTHVKPPDPRGRPVRVLRSVSHAARTASANQVTPTPAGATTSAVPASTTGAASVPVNVAVPALGISSTLGPALGLNPNGTIEDAPLSGPTWSLPWWYEAGPAPGQPGSAVILGHVDSALGAGKLGVFFRLGDATRGEAITVTLANGTVTSWDVLSVRLYPDNRFPDALVYTRSGPPLLRLVTCGGAFDYQTHAYRSALVVTARPVNAAQAGPAG
ncbi:MAG: class F sortase [Acidimicrobiales bacterium]